MWYAGLCMALVLIAMIVAWLAVEADMRTYWRAHWGSASKADRRLDMLRRRMEYLNRRVTEAQAQSRRADYDAHEAASLAWALALLERLDPYGKKTR